MARGKVLRAAAGIAGAPWAVFVVAVVVRLAVLWQLLPVQNTHGFYDHNEQVRIAAMMVSGHGFSSPWPDVPLAPTAQQPPLYPWILAAIFKCFGAYTYASIFAAVFLNAICAGLSAVLLLNLGKRLFCMPAGILASWMWACWIYEAAVSMRLWETSLSALLLLVGMWLSLRLRESSSRSDWMLFGALAGIAALANTTTLAVFVALWIWLFARVGSQSRRRIAPSVLACVLVLIPWTIRNAVTLHHLVPVRDNFGFELWQGNHEAAGDFAEFARLGEIGFMQARRDTALEFIASHPGEFLRRCGVRLCRFWTDPGGGTWLVASGLAWLGAVLALWRRRRDAMPLVIALGVFPLVYYVTHPGTPYRHPIEPEILLLASFTAVSAASWLRDRMKRDGGPAT